MNLRPPSRRVLLATIGVLIVVWWFTQPEDASAPYVRPMPSVNASPGLEPSWLRHVDNSRPECVKLREELSEAAANGSGADLMYIGNCDLRLKQHERPE